MQPLSDFFGIVLVVEFQQAGKDFSAGGFAYRVAQPLLRLMEAVAQVEVGPAIGGGNGLIHFDVELTELQNVGTGFSGVVEAVVGLRQPFLPGEHDLAAIVVITLSDGIESRGIDGKGVSSN